MKLDKLASALWLTRAHGLDEIDVLIINDVLVGLAAKEEVTITKIMISSKAASPATIHARIKKLCDVNILKKVTQTDNLRIKELETGPAFQKLIDELREV